MTRTKLNAVTTVRLPKPLRVALDQEAEERGEKPSELIRQYVRAGLKASGVNDLGEEERDNRDIDITPVMHELKTLSLDLARVGGNLNQIAHYFNINDTVNEGELARVHRALFSHFQDIAKFLKQLRRDLF